MIGSPSRRRWIVARPHDAALEEEPPTGLVRSAGGEPTGVLTALTFVRDGGDRLVPARSQRPLPMDGPGAERLWGAAAPAASAPALPFGARPHVLHESGGGTAGWLAGRCVDVRRDPRDGAVIGIWRFDLPRSRTSPRRLVVSAERGDSPRAPEALLPLLPFGALSYAVEPGARSSQPADDLEREDLEIERYRQLEHLGEPTLPIERYARISADLAQVPPRDPRRPPPLEGGQSLPLEGGQSLPLEGGQSPTREATLARHGLTEQRWMIEEAAWLQRLAEAAQRGDGAPAEQVGRLTAEAHREIAASRGVLSRDALARLDATTRSADDPSKVLSDAGVGMGTWLSSELHWQGRGT